MLTVLQNTARELIRRRHIKTTVGTTVKGHCRIVQYRIIQYAGGHVQATLTPQTGEDRIETERLPDLHLEDGTARLQHIRLCQPNFF